MESGFIAPLERLVEQFRRLPGIGYKTAVRLAFHMLEQPKEKAQEFASAVLEAKERIRFCKICQNISEHELCPICEDPGRDESLICVVEHSKDVSAIERVKEYRGKYHVLGGLISPMDGIGPADLKIAELLDRLKGDEVKELILATNPSVEGEATALYLSKLAKPLGVRVTRLAYGLPVGGELEFADEVTLSRAIEGRKEL